MANLYNGSSGDDVKKLQTALVNAGYSVGSTGVDGQFGSATEAAVRKYQADNGLDVDGIAGTQTLGKLYSSSSTPVATSTTTAKSTTSSTPASSTTQTKTGYDAASDAAYQQALSALQAAQKNAPSYAGTYDGQLKDLYDQIVNRDKFSYDINSDMLYQQYAQQYQDKGRLAMQDTMGQAAALTGGYGSSYAQSVGQQQYDAYLQQLNDVIPELYNQAYTQYQNEGDQLLNQYSMLGDLQDQEYSRYQDQYNQWLTERDYAQDVADQAYNRGYTQWAANQEQANTDREYQLALDKWNYQKEQDAAAAAASSSSSSGGGSSSSGSSSSGSSGYSSEIAAMQKKLNSMGATLDVDGIWGPATKAAYEKYISGDAGETVTYNDLLGAVSTAKGASSRADASTRSQTYTESIQAINDALKNGQITSEEAKELKRIAVPSAR